MDLAIPGFHYNRINNPTNDVLEKRIAALEDGTAALVVASGMAAVSYAILTVATRGIELRRRPTALRRDVHLLRPRALDAWHRGALRRRRPGGVDRCAHRRTNVLCLRGVVGNPAGNVVDLEAVADVAHRAGVPLIVDNTVATPLDAEAASSRRRRRRALADEIRRRSRHHPGRSHRRRRDVPWADTPNVFRCSTNPRSPFTTSFSRATFRRGPSSFGLAPSNFAIPAPRCHHSTPFNSSRASRRSPCDSNDTNPTREPSPTTSRGPPRRMGQFRRIRGQSVSRPRPEVSRRVGCRRSSPLA